LHAVTNVVVDGVKIRRAQWPQLQWHAVRCSRCTNSTVKLWWFFPQRQTRV